MNLCDTLYFLTPAVAADVLRKAKSSIATPQQWWRGEKYEPGAAGKSCAGLAIMASGKTEEVHDACHYFYHAIEAPWHDLSYIYVWNDHPERTHAQVMEAFDKAIELAK